MKKRPTKAARLAQAQRNAAKLCELYQKHFEAGRPFALFEAIAECASCGIPTPPWAADAFCDGVKRIRDGKHRTLDQAFGKPHAKGAHIGKDEALMWRIWWHVRDDRNRHTDDNYFDQLSEEIFGHSGGTIKRLYYRAEAAWKDLKKARDAAG